MTSSALSVKAEHWTQQKKPKLLSLVGVKYFGKLMEPSRSGVLIRQNWQVD